jgi:hypothetical protein
LFRFTGAIRAGGGDVSLLEGGALYEDCTLFPEESVTDLAGNPRTRPSATGVPIKARFQPVSYNSAGAGVQESESVGFQTQMVYAVRFPNGTPQIGAQAEIEWRGCRYAMTGDANHYNSSPRTSHDIYFVERR